MMDKRKSFSISNSARLKIKIQRSSFIGSVGFVSSIDGAEIFIEKIRKEFIKATHNCYAYRLDPNRFRFSDDGEPSGTAGRPILMALEKHKLEKVVLVVTRYFGGIKLGRGGLLRAYGLCAEQTIVQAGVREVIPLQALRLSYPYNFTNTIENIINKYSGKIILSDYKERISAAIQIPQKFYDKFLDEILSVGSKEIQVKKD